MTNRFFESPILNSPYECPTKHWELDADGQPTQQEIPGRRRASFITPIPKPRKQKGSSKQQVLIVDKGKGLSTADQQYAKGLEFRAVVVMACDDEVIPSQERIETVADDADLEEVYNTERPLLYVAITRARDHLLITGITPASEFLEDLCNRGMARR